MGCSAVSQQQQGLGRKELTGSVILNLPQGCRGGMAALNSWSQVAGSGTTGVQHLHSQAWEGRGAVKEALATRDTQPRASTCVSTASLPLLALVTNSTPPEHLITSRNAFRTSMAA